MTTQKNSSVQPVGILSEDKVVPTYGRITLYLYLKLVDYIDNLICEAVLEYGTDLVFPDDLCQSLSKRVEEAEALAAKLILNRKPEPCAALRQAIEILNYPEPE